MWVSLYLAFVAHAPAQLSGADLPEPESISCGAYLVDSPALLCPEVDPNCDPNLDPTDPRFSCGLFSSIFEAQHDPIGVDAGAPVYEIQLVFHLIEGQAGRGHVTDEQVREQVRVLNEDFRALHGTRGERGVDVGLQFVLATRDPEGRPSSGITRSVNPSWFADRDPTAYSAALAWDVGRYVNIYVNEPPGYSGYVPWYPQQWIFRTFIEDRIVVSHATVGRPGRVLTHEMGHYLGLRHVFEYGCYELTDPYAICQTIGDLICDTPPTSESAGCPTEKLACDGSPAPFRNYMDYSRGSCQGEFTPQQANRMRCTLALWRPDLGRVVEPGAIPAEARVRNAGENPYLLWATEPWMGETLELFVRNRQHERVTLVASRRPAERVRAAGVLLIDTQQRPLLVLGETTGPVLSVRLHIPPSPSLVGARFFAQAFLQGDAPDQLTNAVDLRIGLKGVN